MMMFTMFTFMFVGITFERTKREGEKGMRFQHLGDTLNTTTDDIAENTTSTTKLTFTLYTACSPMDKVLPTLRGKGSDDINDDDVKEYDWFSRVKAKLVLKDDDENIGGNDFSFNRGIPMEQITCGEYRVETGLMKRGTAFGFALYEIPPKDDDDDDVSSLGRLIHYENQRNDAYEFEPEGAVVVKDIGCLTTDPKRVDKRCPWGERGGVVGGYSSSIAEDEREHPFGMRECTYKYEYGDVTFYNRVFDGKQLEYVWGSCLESCPAFTKHPFCAAAATPTSPPIEEVEEKKEEEEEEESSTSNQTSEGNDEEEEMRKTTKKSLRAKMAITSSPTERRIPAANARLVLFRSRRTTRLANCVRKDFSNRSVRANGARRVRKACTKTKKVRGFANRATDRRYRRTI